MQYRGVPNASVTIMVKFDYDYSMPKKAMRISIDAELWEEARALEHINWSRLIEPVIRERVVLEKEAARIKDQSTKASIRAISRQSPKGFG